MSYELVPEIGRVPEYVIPLSKTQEERVEELLEEGYFIDLHQHPLLLTKNLDELTRYFRSHRLKYGYEGLAHGRWTAVCNVVSLSRRGRWSDLPPQRGEIPTLFEDIIVELGFMLEDLEKHADKAIRVSRTDDIVRAKKEGKLAIMPTLEHLAIENVLDRVDLYYGFGVREAGLTYTYRTYIGDGQSERYDSGLSEFGLDVVQRMNEVGMLIDLAHTGFTTSMDTIEASKDPVVYSHAGAFTLRPTKRQRKDEELKAMAEKGGMIGVLAVPNSLTDNKEQGIDDVLKHLDYLVKLIGIDHVGVGTDIMFGDHVGLHRQLLFKQMQKGGMMHGLEAPYMKGIESPAEGFNYIRGMVRDGYSDAEIMKVMGDNAMRVFRRVIG